MGPPPPQFFAGLSVNQALATVRRVLFDAGFPEATGDSRHLLCYATGLSYESLVMDHQRVLSGDSAEKLSIGLTKRLHNQPIALITRKRVFWDRDIFVTKDVLIPRPETETLIALGLQQRFLRVLDLGTGSGCILVVLLAMRERATGLGVDISPLSLVVAKRNLATYGLSQRGHVRLSDWFDTVGEKFDLIIANPPYVTASEWAALSADIRLWEPYHALVARNGADSADGLAAYRCFVPQVLDHLTPNGCILLESAPWQTTEVAMLLNQAGLCHITIHRDLSNHPRVIAAHAPV